MDAQRLSSLNDQQRAAATFGIDPLLIIAGSILDRFERISLEPKLQSDRSASTAPVNDIRKKVASMWA